MKTVLLASILLSAAPIAAHAQSQSTEDLTRRLNGGPPVIAQAAPQATTPAVRPGPSASGATVATPATRPAPSATPAATPRSAAASSPRPAATTPVAPSGSVAAPPATAPAPSAGSAPAPGALGPAAVAALPFRIELSSGTQLFEGRAAPGAKVWSVRKAGKTLAMIYAGPASQFPIYDGEQVTAAGRVSVIVPEGTRRIAMEHLFQRPAAPTEIHVWLMSLDGADRDAAERIAQSVDPR